MNPLWIMLWKLTGKSFGFTQDERKCDRNAARYKAVLLEYVRKRRSGEIKSDLADEADLISQMLKAPDVYSDIDIVDEIVDLLSAGTMTTQFSVQGALAHLCTNPESLARVRAEFDPIVEKAGSYEAAFKDDLTYDQLRDMNFVTCVFHESLRKNSVANLTGAYTFA